MSNPTHAPTPWKVGGDCITSPSGLRPLIHSCLDDEINPVIAEILTTNGQQTAEANARLIVQAVNYHDALIDALAAITADYKAMRAAYLKGAHADTPAITRALDLLERIKQEAAS